MPGMGGLLVDVIKRQDNTMVQALVLIFATVGILGLLLGDLFMTLADPRIRLDQKGGGAVMALFRYKDSKTQAWPTT